jgi:murein DD-endopeptidase MepM/ murein hydrolase activator NlpD
LQDCGEKLSPGFLIVKDGKAETRSLKFSGVVGRNYGVSAAKRNTLRLLMLAAVVGVAGGVLPGGESVTGSDGDTLLGMPVSGEVDHRFDFLSVWERVKIPLALRFDPPLGTNHSGLIYNAQKFWEMNDKRGGHHTGDDLNGIGGMNTDLGDPVFCTADGLVLYAGEPSAGWGKVVVIGHRTADGKVLHSMYAHLQRIDAKRGDLISRGGNVGTVGTANGYYPAHLHFEMRSSDEVDIGAGYAALPLSRLDPLATVEALKNAAAEDLSPSPLGVLLQK